MIETLLFYVFAAVCVGSGLMVISARNPVHSVLFLILAFFSATWLMVLLGAEFIAMMLVVVYVGAVMVLFLFVVMMLDINFAKLREGMKSYWPVGLAVGGVLLAEILMLGGAKMADEGHGPAIAAPIPDPSQVTNTEALGRLFYTDYLFLFEMAGLVLLVAMVGAILLTHRQTTGVKRQKIADQIAVTKADRLSVKKVPSGGGL